MKNYRVQIEDSVSGTIQVFSSDNQSDIIWLYLQMKADKNKTVRLLDDAGHYFKVALDVTYKIAHESTTDLHFSNEMSAEAFNLLRKKDANRRAG